MRLLIAFALSAAALRLLFLGWLHPLNFDEIEFFRATDWVRRGLVPYRDFWEHHTPLQWYLFAPLSALARGEGAGAVIAMRWLQVPLWIATFALAMQWMRRMDIAAPARWAAIGVAVASSFFMSPAVEYRVDVLGCALYLAGVVCAGRMRDAKSWAVAAGAALTLAAFANIRLGPLIAATVVLYALVDPRERRWRVNRSTDWMLFGVGGAVALVFGAFAAAGALDEAMQQVWFDNYIGDRLARAREGELFRRVAVSFGVLVRGSGIGFEPAAVDPGAIVLMVFGALGIALALRTWRRPDELFVAAVLQLVSVAFIARMQRVYNYHFEIVTLMMLPLVAIVFARIKSRPLTAAILMAAWCASAAASVFRGKEDDLAWQDLVMREAHARTLPHEKVWDGAGWALRREPAYRFWFLAELPQLLVQHGHAERYRVEDLISNPPAAIIPDYYVRLWLANDARLAPFVATHYLPLWRDLWLPAPNARLPAGPAGMSWVVLRDGDYRLFTAPRLAGHPWFAAPISTDVLDRRDAGQFPIQLRRPSANAPLEWSVDSRPADLSSGRIRLRKGQRLSVMNRSGTELGVMLVQGTETAWFRQPPPGTTLEAAYGKRLHVPFFRVRAGR